MELTQTPPKKHQRRVKTTGELIEERGYKRGFAEGFVKGFVEGFAKIKAAAMEKGMRVEMEWIVRSYLLNLPQKTDEEVVVSFGTPLELVKKVRQKIQEDMDAGILHVHDAKT